VSLLFSLHILGQENEQLHLTNRRGLQVIAALAAVVTDSALRFGQRQTFQSNIPPPSSVLKTKFSYNVSQAGD
jgi:hypothetical protein